MCEILNNASLSITNFSSEFSNNWCIDNVALYGSTTTSDAFSDGYYTKNVHVILSGYATLILILFDILMSSSSDILLIIYYYAIHFQHYISFLFNVNSSCWYSSSSSIPGIA